MHLKKWNPGCYSGQNIMKSRGSDCMPYRPKTPCKHLGCGMLVDYGQKFCENHKALHPEYARPANKRGHNWSS